MKCIKIIIVVILPFFLSCNLPIRKKLESKTNIKAVRLSRRFPEINFNTGKIIKYSPDEVEIYFWKEKTMYKEPYDYYYLNKEGGIDSIRKRVSYLVISSGSIQGCYFEKNNGFAGQQVLFDSIFREKWYGHGTVDSIKQKCNVVLNATVFESDSGILKHTYSVRDKSDTSMTSTVILSYTNEKKALSINYYSIAKDFDTIKTMKLIKVLVVSHARYFKDYNYTMDQFEINRDLELIQIDSLPADVALYFKKANDLDERKGVK